MPRTILVTEGDTPLGAELARLLVERGHSVASASDPADSERNAAESRNPLSLRWNRRSPVSARSVVLSVLNAFGKLDEALILEPAVPRPSQLDKMPSADIDRAFDDAKGPMLLVRELIAIFARVGAGTLGFVSGGAASGPVENATREAFRGLGAALMASPGPGVVANGFQAGLAGPEEYAAFIDRTLEERARKVSGRWYSFPPRGGFLQGVFRTSSTP
jgi:NAD(P)-dependent dehydrogenase (short-subunit alcohol dehydrogenase family)